MPAAVTCAICGMAFSVRPCLVRDKNYCSKPCADASKRRPGTPFGRDGTLELRRAYFRAYNEKTRDRQNASRREWGKQNRDYKNKVQRLSREAGHISKSLRAQIFASYGHRCCACGATERLEIDHIVATSQGGKSESSNLQVLCRRCNASKGIKVLIGSEIVQEMNL